MGTSNGGPPPRSRAPLPARALWGLVRLLERDDPAKAVTPAAIERGRERRKRLIRLPVAWVVVGRPHPGVSTVDDVAVLPDGTRLPIRVYRPRRASGPLPVVVNFHGGGFMRGDPRQSEWWCGNVAARTPALVVSVDYRLAPAHPFPTAAEDAYAATCWVVDSAGRLGADPARLAVMGDSAGGNLAAVVSLLARDRGGPAICLQVLLYPVVDLVNEYPSEIVNARAPLLGKREMDRFHGTYLAGRDGSDPRASPLLAADHGRLPAAVIETAEHDPLRDQGIAYAHALRAAGGAVRHTHHGRAVHGFVSVPGIDPAARAALGEVVDALRAAFTPPQTSEFPLNPGPGVG
jgi:acetyl esterase